MTPAGADSRANYLLKWEAIRSSREQGATCYDLWGLAHARHRPLQDRLRRARDPLHRRVRPRARPARAAARTPSPSAARVRVERLRHGLQGRLVGVGVRGGRGRRRGRGADGRPASWTPDELDDWDARAVDAEGGHVLQSRAWAAHREATGWEARFHVVGDAARRSSLVRPWHGHRRRLGVRAARPGRRRHAVGDGRRRRRVGAALAALAVHLSDGGIDVLAADPEVADADAAYRRALDAVGFHGIPEIQPSRHRMALPLPAGADEAGGHGRHREGDPPADPARRARRRRRRALGRRRRRSSRAPSAPTEDGADALRPVLRPAARDRRPARLRVRRARGVRRRGGGRALEAGHLVYLEAREGARTATCWAGLVLYRHGRRLSTAAQRRPRRAAARPPGRACTSSAGGRSSSRSRRAGPRWTSAASTSPGARRIPTEGEPTYGLYEHKRSFGAEWVALAGAQERVARPWRYALGRGARSRVERLVTPGRAPAR